MGSQKRPHSSQEGNVTRSPNSKRVIAQGGASQGTNKTETAASRSKIQRILNTHRIYLDRQKRKPDSLRDLIDEIREIRSGPPTPDSREIARIHPFTCLMQELDAIISLEDYLGYRSEHQQGGQPNIYRGHNHSWRRGSVPCPSTKDREYLAEALASVGSPPDPRPDIAYGYTHTAFDQQEQDVLASLPVEASVCCDEPRFPYFVIEWKSARGGGNMWDAERQALRDGAAAVNAMWTWCRALGNDTPSPAETAVFSACVDSRTIAIRAHWRYMADNGEACFEADLLDEGFLRSEADNFRIRSIIMNMLEWARGPRLDFIRHSLSIKIPSDDEEQLTRSETLNESEGGYAEEVLQHNRSAISPLCADSTTTSVRGSPTLTLTNQSNDLPTPASSNTSSPTTPARKKRRISD